MRALVFHAPRDVRHERVADAALEEPGDAVVRVTLAGLCGSDLHPYRGRERGLDPGTVMGHELVGVVEEVGAEAMRFRPGDRVAAPFSTSCGACFYCRTGLTSRCGRGQLFGWRQGGRGLDGAQAEAVRVPLADATLVAVPEAVSDVAALVAGDNLATGLYCAELAEVGPGRATAIVGCGPVGLLAIQACRELGAGPLFAIDRLAERLALAERFGAEPLALDDEPVARVRRATAGRGADAVLEIVGTPEATRLAYELVRPGGVVAAAGFHTEERLAFSPGEAYDKNLTYRAGRCPARRFMGGLLEGLAAGRFDVAPLVTHRLPLAEGRRAYELSDRRLERCVKIVLAP